jgi:hypothetical protein
MSEISYRHEEGWEQPVGQLAYALVLAYNNKMDEPLSRRGLLRIGSLIKSFWWPPRPAVNIFHDLLLARAKRSG